jgi:hypothetical protein
MLPPAGDAMGLLTMRGILVGVAEGGARSTFRDEDDATGRMEGEPTMMGRPDLAFRIVDAPLTVDSDWLDETDARWFNADSTDDLGLRTLLAVAGGAVSGGAETLRAIGPEIDKVLSVSLLTGLYRSPFPLLDPSNQARQSPSEALP